MPSSVGTNTPPDDDVGEPESKRFAGDLILGFLLYLLAYEVFHARSGRRPGTI